MMVCFVCSGIGGVFIRIRDIMCMLSNDVDNVWFPKQKMRCVVSQVIADVCGLPSVC